MVEATDGKVSRHTMKPSPKAELGQIFTPLPVAHMMAAMLQCRFEEVSLLDAGAGIGTLTGSRHRELLPACALRASEGSSRHLVTGRAECPD